jgi:tetratricopeptide (TPR) repeat protein/serine/threonine protein kinase
MSHVQVGRYHLTSELGRGGMGIVYKALDPMLERDLAIKILPPKKLSQDLIDRFMREARAVAKLDSPNIVKIYDIGRQPDGDLEINYIVMEFVEGENLGEIFPGAPGDLSDLEARLAVLDQVLEAIDYAHDKGVVHRDLKPDNIMVTQAGRAKIMDFGLAFFSGSHSLTRVNQVMGTVAYFSPEQARGAKDIDHRADLYSLGVILFELMTGELPFEAVHVVDMMRKVLDEAPRRPSKLNSLVSAELESVCLKCLEKDPANRYPTVGDFRKALQNALVPEVGDNVSGTDGGQGAVPRPKVKRPSKAVVSKFLSRVSAPPFTAPHGPGQPPSNQIAAELTNRTGTDVPFEQPGGVTNDEGSDLDLSALLGTVVDPARHEREDKEPRKPKDRPSVPDRIRTLHPALASSNWQHEVDQGKEPDESAEEQAPPVSSASKPKIVGPGIFCQCGAENPPDTDTCYECGEEIKPSIHIVRQDANAHYNKGTEAVTRGHLEEARRELKLAVEKNPEFGEAYLLLGKTELSLGHFEDAHDNLEASMSFLPSKFESLMSLADLYQQVEQPEDVITCLQDILSDYPRDTKIRCRLALLYGQLGQTNKALAAYRKALQYEPNDLATNRQLGLLFASEGADDEAIYYLEIVSRLDPNDGHIRGLLGRLYASRGQYRQAEDSFARAVELRPKDPELRVEMSHLYRQQGRLDKASQVLQKTLSKVSGHLAASRLLAEVRLDSGDLEGARSCLEEAIRFHPEDDRLHRQLGEVYLLLGHLDGALDCFEKVVELRPDCARMRNQLGRIYLKKSYDEQSIAEYREAVNLHPLEPLYREDLGMAYYVSGNLPEAAAELHKATRLDGRNADYFKALGFIYDEMGNPDQAVDHFKYALHLDPNDSRTLSALAKARVSQGLAHGAVDLYRKALQLEPGLTLLHLNLARALAAAGRSKEAVQSFRDFAASVGDQADSQMLSSVFLEMGQTLFSTGDSGQAAEVFQAALSHPESEAQARVGLARISLSRSDYKAAAVHLKRALEVEPRNAEVWQNWSILAGENGDWSEAVVRMEQAIKLDNDNPELWVQLGRCYRKAGRAEDADHTFKKACDHFPEQKARFLWLRGRLAIRKKDWTRAYEFLNRSFQLAPGSWRIHEDMAQACIGLQNWTQAEENIRQAAAMAPAGKKSSVLSLLKRLPR